MNVMKGPSLLWISINPPDVGDPIAQVFVGEQIDMDMFERTSGPNSLQRTMNIAGDPYAAAKFFHFVITALLEELFGIKAFCKSSHVTWTDGIFSKVASYIGTVEAQGRGTFHLHIVIWSVGALTHVEMKAALKSELFWSKVKDYIATNIQAEINGGDRATVLAMSWHSALSYPRPIDPKRPDYQVSAKDTELKLARAVQHHVCDKDTCLVSKKGVIYCKH
jgi:hypothetical protein